MSERTLEQQARDRIEDDCYEYARDEGYIRWYEATRIDPGYWSDDLDIDIEFRRQVDEDGGEVGIEADVQVWLGSYVIIERVYECHLDKDGYAVVRGEDK